MSNMDPEVVNIHGGCIEVHPCVMTTIMRQAHGSTAAGDPQYRRASLRLHLIGLDGFFAFDLSPAEARALTAAIERHSPDAES